MCAFEISGTGKENVHGHSGEDEMAHNKAKEHKHKQYEEDKYIRLSLSKHSKKNLGVLGSMNCLSSYYIFWRFFSKTIDKTLSYIKTPHISTLSDLFPINLPCPCPKVSIYASNCESE